jgi:demethoxyubiquinone hydroxylase (CLK1/Coq7/Cat5 family)
MGSSLEKGLLTMTPAPPPTRTAIAGPSSETPEPISENDRWLLSYYRSSEIDGAVFFGKVAEAVRSPDLAADIAQHFADEAKHAAIWTRCLSDLGVDPLRIRGSYQSQYFDTIGAPANLMEILAITQVFERRVIGQYHRQLRYPSTHPRVRTALEQIMADERWHLQYVRRALASMTDRYGAERVEATIARYTQADNEVYARTLAEYGDRMAFVAKNVSG